MRILSERGLFRNKWFIEFAGSKFEIPSQEECIQIKSIYSSSVLIAEDMLNIFNYTEAEKEEKRVQDEQFHLFLLKSLYKEV